MQCIVPYFLLFSIFVRLSIKAFNKIVSKFFLRYRVKMLPSYLLAIHIPLCTRTENQISLQVVLNYGHTKLSKHIYRNNRYVIKYYLIN